MKKYISRRNLLVSASALAATAADAAGRGKIKLRGHGTPTGVVPVITSNGGGPTATINITAADTAVTTVVATGSAPITYTKSGTNAALFSINASTGVLALLVAQSVGSYAVTVTATNSAGADSQAITLNVSAVTAGFSTLKVGAGGQLTRIDIAPDGTMVTRADTYGAYLWSVAQSKWINLVSSLTMPSPAVSAPYSLPWGCYEIRVAASNTNRLYMATGNDIFMSNDKGVTWTSTGFSSNLVLSFYFNSNLDTKFNGPYIAIDPHNDQKVFVSTPLDGLFVSTNAGGSWTLVSTAQVPKSTITIQGQGIGHFLYFDPASWVSGNTPTIYATSNLVVRKSTDGGSTFSVISGGGGSAPNAAYNLFCDHLGTLWVQGTNATDTNLFKYVGSTWTQFTFNNDQRSVAIDPASASAGATKVIAFNVAGACWRSDNGGTSWSAQQNPTRVATDIPWLEVTLETSLTVGNTIWAPDGNIYLTGGISIWKVVGSAIPNSGVPVTWTSQSVGIEQLVADSALSPPNGNPILSFRDRPVFTIVDQNNYPTQHGTTYAVSISEGWHADYASTDPTFIAALNSGGSSGNEQSGYSTNGGGSDGGPSNWTLFSNFPTNLSFNGAIAASTPNNLVVASYNSGLIYTTDRGATAWHAPTISGGAILSTDSGWYPFSVSLRRVAVCTDRVLANTFYAYNNGATAPGIYVSTDSGVTWAKKFTGKIDSSYDNFNFIMRSVPGQSGNFYTACGGADFATISSSFDEWNWNGGALIRTNLFNVVTVWGFGFGKAKPGGSGYPAIYIYGKVSGVIGIFRSDDHCATWVQLSDGFPNNSMDQVVCVEGDMNTYGTCYVGFNGSGFAVYAL